MLRYGERLDDDGMLDQNEIASHVKSGQFQTDTYILKGEGTEVWEPRFAYHGFQYVEVTGLPGQADARYACAAASCTRLRPGRARSSAPTTLFNRDPA